MTSQSSWLQLLPDAEQQRAIDNWAIEQLGIAGVDLMERAGAGLAELVQARAPDGRVAVVCGKGNNGGDGLVVARLLRERGREVDVLLLGAPEQLRGDAAANLQRLPGEAPAPLRPGALGNADVVIDAILGTGFSGEPRDPARGAIEAINALPDATVIACDVPSGVDASTGETAGAAVRAAATATFHAGKPGLWISPGKAHAGDVTVIDIGIPGGAPVAPEIGLIDAEVLAQVPQRGRESTKFAAGAVLVCGGSLGLTGAPCMVSEAAMRAGAGYVTALIPESLNLVFEQRLLEVMSVPLPDRGGALQPAGADQVREHAKRANALVLGPGLGRAAESAELCRELAATVQLSLVLDADGLNAHAGRLGVLACAPRGDRADSARRRDRAAARSSPRRRSSPSGFATCALRRARPMRWSCSRATTRWWPTRRAGSRSAGAAPSRWPQRAPATCCPGSWAPTCPRRWTRSRPPAPPSSCTRARAGWRRTRSGPRA